MDISISATSKLAYTAAYCFVNRTHFIREGKRYLVTKADLKGGRTGRLFLTLEPVGFSIPDRIR